MCHRAGINLVFKLHVLLSLWENTNIFIDTENRGPRMQKSSSPITKLQGYMLLQNTKRWISDKGYPPKRPQSWKLPDRTREHAFPKKFNRKMGEILVSWHFILLNSWWEKNKRDEGIRLPWQRGEAWLVPWSWQSWASRFYKRETGLLRPGDWVEMNILLFLYTSATLPDF